MCAAAHAGRTKHICEYGGFSGKSNILLLINIGCKKKDSAIKSATSQIYKPLCVIIKRTIPMQKSILLIYIFINSLFAYSQDFDKGKMDSLFYKIEKCDKGMGSISIFKNGNEVYHKSYGHENIEEGIHTTKMTKYCIGSITKSFTATIIMQLAEENKLSLNTKLSKFFPEIPNSQQITIEQLLRHRSGLVNYTDKPDFLKWSDTLRTKEEMIGRFVENGILFKPEEKSKYCNTGYVLLSYIAQEIEEKEYAEILEERIIDPLNLEATYFSKSYGKKENEAQSYFKYGSWKAGGVSNLGNYDGAGGIVSNPTDLNTFFYALFSGKIVSMNSLQKMKTIVDGYGIGMYQLPFYERSALGHAGDIGGFQSVSEYFLEDSMMFSFIANGIAMSRNDILEGVLSIYFGREYNLPSFTTYKVSNADLDKYLGVYSSPDSPYKLIFTKKNGMLLCTPTDQPSLPMEAIEKHKFRFSQADLKIIFILDEDKIIVSQGGDETFYKEK